MLQQISLCKIRNHLRMQVVCILNKEELEITKYELNKEVELKEHFECS